MPDKVSIGGTTREKLSKPDGSWQVTVEICNLTDKEMKVHVVENPWREDNGRRGDKYYLNDKSLVPGEEKKEVPGSAWKKASDAGKDVTLRPKGEKPDDCRKVTFVYPFEPFEAYTDVYDPNASYSFSEGQPHTIPGGADTYQFPKQTGWLPPGRARRYLAVTVPLPYPMWAEVAARGKPIKVAIKAVKGLPRGWRVVGTLPAMGQAVWLDSGDRGSTAAVLLEQRSALAPGKTFRVAVHQHIVHPRALAGVCFSFLPRGAA